MRISPLYHQLHNLLSQPMAWADQRHLQTLMLIEDTSMLWNEYCLIRLSLQYRGRAVLIVWRVIRQAVAVCGLSVSNNVETGCSLGAC